MGTEWNTDWQSYVDNPSTCPDNLLFCFVGNNEDGFTVYSKSQGSNALQNQAAWDLDPATSGSGVDPTWQELTKCVFTPPTDFGDLTLNKVWFKAGDGTDHDGMAATDRYKMETRDALGNAYGVRADGGNVYYFMMGNDWGSIYQFQFYYISGAVTAVSVASQTPAANAVDVATDASVSVSFNANITLAVGASATIKDADGNEVTGVALSVNGSSLEIAHDAFAPSTVYTVTVPAGAVDDFSSDISWSFTTAASSETAPNPTAGLPFKVSGNTSDQAVWYIINWNTGDTGIKPWQVNGDGTFGIAWSGADPANDAQLFCFIGNATDGYKVYSKVALAGDVINGVTLTEDLPVENFGDAASWSLGGFTTTPTVSGSDLLDSWFFDIGQGQGVDGGVATTGQTAIYNGSYAWHQSGGSQMEIGPCRNWTAAYSAIFQWVSGQGAPSTYTITVNGGTADQTEALAGATVNLTADAPAAGQVFDHWECSDVTFNSAVKLTTSFAMPETDVTITAVYVDVVDGDHITAGTDTGDGAVWYIIRWNCGGADAFRPFAFYTTNTLGHEWGAADTTNYAQQFCFIGNATSGYKVYNRTMGDLPLTLFADGHLGFTDDASLIADPLVDTWYPTVGDGVTGADGGTQALGLTALYNADSGVTKGWWFDGGSNLVGQTMNSPTFLWAGAFAVVFQYVSGTPGYDAIKAPIVKDGFTVYSEKGKLVIESENAAGALFQVYTITGQKAAGGTLSADRQEVLLSSGAYIVKVGNSVKKVIVK